MVENWITSAAGRKAVGTFSDARPAWLWSGDGKKLFWSNPAARLRGAKAKRSGLKLAAPMTPIKGQVPRLMRLGALGRSSLARMRFTVGKKPVSATCTCTPLSLEDGERALLVVEVDPIDHELMLGHGTSGEIIGDVFGRKAKFALYNEAGELVAGADGENPIVTLPAGPQGEQLAFFESSLPADAAKKDDDLPTEELAEPKSEKPATDAPSAEQQPDGMPDAADSEPGTEDKRLPSNKPEVKESTPHRDLSALLEKLSNDADLFKPLSDDDDEMLSSSEDNQPVEAAEAEDAADAEDSGDTVPDQVHELSTYRIEGEDASQEQMRELEDDPTPGQTISQGANKADNDVDDGLWQVIGRGFEKHFEPAVIAPDHDDTEPAQISEDTGALDAEDTAKVEQTSRYNFAELSRILNDRIAGERSEIRGDAPAKQSQPAGGELLDLPEESVVLNRLPLGLMIFRDQQILFVNRAMTDLVGYPDNASLRAQGLEGIFPRHANDEDPFGPVTHLAHRSGSRVAVSARLQAISWQGVPALMLTAKAQTPTQSIEGAIRAFTEQLAAMQGCGYFETSRAGIVSSVSGLGADLFGRTPQVLIGRPLMLMADHGEAAGLREFLEQAARKAETARPSIILRGIDPRLKIYLFAEGQAGYVTGYFGIVGREGQEQGTNSVAVPDPTLVSHMDPSVLTRLSRSVRRPLNTIIGFAELLQSHAFGPIENTRYVEYARDIKQSGQEIVRAVDELEELVRIDSGDYLAAPVNFDLAALLDTCIAKVRMQAGRERVFVRSAISEHLPNIRADEASLGQAILNLLASAIEQTPPGGHVIVSAQREEDGSVAVHVRNSGATGGDIAEQFVVFKDDAGAEGDTNLRTQSSSVGLALTRSLLAINTCTLAIEAGAGQTTILSLFIPAELATDGV